MITGELKNKIDGLWDIFAAGGLVNPLEVIMDADENEIRNGLGYTVLNKTDTLYSAGTTPYP